MGEMILVTGSTGFIGSRMVDALLSRGVAVRVLLRPESTPSLPESNHAGVEECRAGYRDPEALGRAVRGVSAIIHLAGVTRAVDEVGFFDGNVLPVENILEAVRKHNPELKRFLLVSSLAAAGPASSSWPGVSESDQPNPVSAYGRSKLLGEEAALRYGAKVPVTIVRPPAVYGPGDRDILEVFGMMKKGYLVSAGSAKRQRFSMVHVDDLIEGILLALRSEAAAGGTYYITAPRAYGWDEVIAAARPVLGFGRLLRISLPDPLVFGLGAVFGAAAGITGKSSLINRDKATELVQDYWVCSHEKAERELGFVARTTLTEGVVTTLQWYQRKGWL
ncbi:MAG: NAD-dependent epimerase/dehydratase family protein [Chlorobiaceae bacterium]|nr:NAD-dependent epimerase/dehydratase family protein [Chlorobiaceae bacterium]